jgi:hypothetical protein
MGCMLLFTSRYRLKPPGGGLRSKALRLEGWVQFMNDAHLIDAQFTLQVRIGLVYKQRTQVGSWVHRIDAQFTLQAGGWVHVIDA